jgi:hypothetical protein
MKTQNNKDRAFLMEAINGRHSFYDSFETRHQMN